MVCCELCTANINVGRIWKVKTTLNGTIIICDECHSDVRVSEYEDYNENLINTPAAK
jgi:hypothetical protein